MDYDQLRDFAVNGSEDAFKQLVERYTPLVYGSCFRRLGDATEAEDATQAVFIVLSKKASKISEDTVLPAWLIQTSKFVCGTMLRANKKRKSFLKALPVDKPDGSLKEEEKQKLKERIDFVLDKLPQNSREAICLHYLMGQTHQEVAKAMNSTEEAVRKRITRALHTLKGKVGRFGFVVSPNTLEQFLTNDLAVNIPIGMEQKVLTTTLTKQTAVVEPVLRNIKIAEGAIKMAKLGIMKKISAIFIGFVLVGCAGVFFKKKENDKNNYWSTRLYEMVEKTQLVKIEFHRGLEPYTLSDSELEVFKEEIKSLIGTPVLSRDANKKWRKNSSSISSKNMAGTKLKVDYFTIAFGSYRDGKYLGVDKHISIKWMPKTMEFNDTWPIPNRLEKMLGKYHQKVLDLGITH